MKKKLKLSRETVRALTPAQMDHAHGGLRDTGTCYCPASWVTCNASQCKASVCNSCYHTDCCLMEP